MKANRRFRKCPVCGHLIECHNDAAETMVCTLCGTHDSLRQFQLTDSDGNALVTTANGEPPTGIVVGRDMTVDDLRKLATTFGFDIVPAPIVEQFADTISLMVGQVAESRKHGDNHDAEMVEQFVPALQSVFYAIRR